MLELVFRINHDTAPVEQYGLIALLKSPDQQPRPLTTEPPLPLKENMITLQDFAGHRYGQMVKCVHY